MNGWMLSPVTVQEAVRWATENKVKLVEGNRLAQINDHRESSGLPPFRVVKSAEERVEALPTPAVPVAARPGGPAPLVSNQMELINLVTEHSGTRTGLITPEIADWLLALNTHNRPLNHGTVGRFVDILKEGRWQNTGEPIIVSSEGVLNDGQHRLRGIRDSGVGAICDVRFGIARSAFGVTGTGTKRTAGKRGGDRGAQVGDGPGWNSAAAVDPQFGIMAQHKVRIDTDLVLQVIERETMIAKIAEKIQRFTFAPTRTAPFGMILVVAARLAPFDEVMAFADIASGGLCQDEDMAPRRLHVRLRDEALSRRRVSQLDVAILTARAWNAWTVRKPLGRLIINDEDRTSAGFPKVLPMVRP